MKTDERDARFDNLLESLEKFDANMDKLRRVNRFLLKAIKEACKSSGKFNIAGYVDIVVCMPIGAVNSMQIEVSFDKGNLQLGKPDWVRIRLLDRGGDEIREGEITSIGLDFVMFNPSPMIDAAAKFCDRLGCLEAFKGKVERFCLMKYKF